MPLVQSGSIFATLQSVAMGGVGTKVVISGSVLGGALGKVRGAHQNHNLVLSLAMFAVLK